MVRTGPFRRGCPKDAEGMANSIEPDQTAPSVQKSDHLLRHIRPKLIFYSICKHNMGVKSVE